jgi:hypothetical protein
MKRKKMSNLSKDLILDGYWVNKKRRKEEHKP